MTGDDSILLKYLNPHVIAVATVHPPEAATAYYHPSSMNRDDSFSPPSQSVMTVTFIDSLSGRTLHRVSHVNGAAPVHATFVDSSSSFVVTYWNCYAKRIELSSISLFDGLVESNALHPFATAATSSTMQQLQRSRNFSSFSAPLPLAMQRTYWLPKISVSGIQTTSTNAAITNKKVLIATSGGQLLSFDMRLISPRRPLTVATQSEKEVGLMQHHPLVLIQPMTAVVTLDQGDTMCDDRFCYLMLYIC